MLLCTVVMLPLSLTHTHRRAEYFRQTRAAAVIQKHVRCFILCRHYHRLRHATITIQACYRGRQGRREYTALLRETKAVVLQRYLRGWLARRVYQCSLRYIVKTQCCVRRWLAQRELKRLKIQARSVDYLKKLNRGMENKIIELQQKLSKQVSCHDNHIVVPFGSLIPRCDMELRPFFNVVAITLQLRGLGQAHHVL